LRVRLRLRTSDAARRKGRKEGAHAAIEKIWRGHANAMGDDGAAAEGKKRIEGLSVAAALAHARWDTRYRSISIHPL
jgi:hypothetical protein